MERFVARRFTHLRTSVLLILGLVFSVTASPKSGFAQDKPEGDALLDHARVPWTGDLDGMYERGLIRILTAPNPLLFLMDGVKKMGVVHDLGQELEKHLNKKRPKGTPRVEVFVVPLPRDRLLKALNGGYGDIVAANLTITPERLKIVDFADPVRKDVKEVLVTGSDAPPVATLDDLVESELHLRETSSYFEHMTALNAERENEGKPVIPIVKADERLEDRDLLDLVNAGIIPATVVDNHKAQFWTQILDKVTVHEDIVINAGGEIGWAIRKDSPKLKESLNVFKKTVRKGSLLGNIILKRYLSNSKWLDNALGGKAMERYSEVVTHLKEYAGKYDFDWLMITAQGYQESKLNQKMRSDKGAIGVMQILPSTAKGPNVRIPDIHLVDRNIEAGVKYLRFLRNRYFSADEIAPMDRLLFSFAAYNAGPGNISKARKRAEKMGLDPNVWFGNVEVAAARAISREPVTYVRKIYKYFVAYKLFEQESAEREAAKKKSGADAASTN